MAYIEQKCPINHFTKDISILMAFFCIIPNFKFIIKYFHFCYKMNIVIYQVRN